MHAAASIAQGDTNTSLTPPASCFDPAPERKKNRPQHAPNQPVPTTRLLAPTKHNRTSPRYVRHSQPTTPQSIRHPTLERALVPRVGFAPPGAPLAPPNSAVAALLALLRDALPSPDPPRLRDELRLCVLVFGVGGRWWVRGGE